MDDAEIRKLAALEGRHWWYAGRRDLLREVAGRPPHPGGGTAYDVGAAAGGNSRVLEDLGWRVVALEFSATGAALAARRGIEVVRGDAQRWPFAGDSAGLVTALDVIEHLPDDVAAVTELARVLRPGGRAVIAVPADPKLWSAHDVAVGHLRRYTPGALHEVVEQAGLTVDALWSWNVLLRPLAAVRRKFSSGSDLGEVPGPLNALFAATLKVERALPALRRRRGVSLVLTATKPAT